MPIIDNLLTDGLNALGEVMARALTFRGSSVTAVSVDWHPRDVVAADGEMDFESRDMSAILVSKSVVATKPEIGETFTDADSRYHRVEMVIDLHDKWRCICIVSQ